MRILIVTDAWHPQVNGVVRTYEHLATHLKKQGHDIKIIGPCDFPLKIPMPGYAEIKLTITPYRRLKKIITHFQPEHIHIATEGPLGWAARKYGIKHDHPFTTAYHTQFPDYVAERTKKIAPFLTTPLYTWAKNKIRRFHAPSKTILTATQSLEEQLRNWHFTTPTHRFSRGININMFKPGDKTLFQDLPKPIALYVGRVAIEKNIEDFLEMDWSGSKVVVGHGPELPELQKKYPDTIFTGKKQEKDLANHYRSADLFVFPSRTDTFGIVLIEALASGLPIAAYNVIGPKDIVTEPFLGTLTENNLSEAAKTALTCGTTTQRANHAKSTYTWETAARQFISAMPKT